MKNSRSEQGVSTPQLKNGKKEGPFLQRYLHERLIVFILIILFFIELEKKTYEKFDSNAEIIVPGNKTVDPTSNPLIKVNEAAQKMSKRKEKDLEKYIAKKLKKDERSSLFERLLNSTVQRDCLQSSRSLGQGHKETKVKFTIIDSFENESDESNESSSESEDMGVFLKSAEIVVEKDPFKATKEILCPSFMESSSEDSTSDDEASEAENTGITKVSFMAGVEPVFNVHVERDPLIQKQRSQLPIFAEEQSIMESIKGNPVVIICGETGSGKTTQVPQFLYEAGYGNSASSNPGMIAVTQPRRVAAVSMAERVGTELNDKSLVAYQIRYDSTTVTDKSVIKFMTDGILLKEIQSDFLLSKYSVILLDEAHERNLNTDILVGLLSRIVKLRWKKAIEDPETYRPLRLVIMSATLNVEEFAKPSLFNPLPPVLRVESRQHPVTVHFNRKTNPDYLEEACKTVSKIHANLPEGGILVFLSGKREILSLVKLLREKFPGPQAGMFKNSEKSVQDDEEADFVSDFEYDDSESEDKDERIIFDPEAEESDAEKDDDEEDSTGFTLGAKTKQPLHILPLFSLMSPEQQMRIFAEPPAGSRLCVVATNVAETSITIKNIRYVVDSGKVKQRIWDSEGRQRYEVVWTSKASVAQRSGRAGRTGPGHCYRLYSSAVYDNDFPAHTPPEIARMPMESLVLQLKNMTIDNVERFPLPTQPERDSVLRAQDHLVHLGALEASTFSITEFGKKVALLPLSPTWGSLLVHALNLARSQASAIKFVPITVAFVSAMTIGEPFNADMDDDEGDQEAKNPVDKTKEPADKSIDWKMFCGKPVSSDLFASLGALLLYLKQSAKIRSKFCQKHRLIEKRLEEMSQQLSQLLRMCSEQLSGLSTFKSCNLADSVSVEEKIFLRRLMAQAFPFQIAEKISVVLPLNDPNRKLASRLPTYRVLGASAQDSIRFLHPSSLLVKIPPKYLVFTEALSVKDRKTGAFRHYLKNVTAIEPNWIPSSTLAKAI